MCYRVATLDTDIMLEEIPFAFPTQLFLDHHSQSVNHRPMELIPVLMKDNDKMIITMMRWGLLPSWIKDETVAKKLGYRTANARSETMFEKPSFKNYLNNRCIILASAFFEPIRFVHTQKKLLFIASIYSVWKDQLTCTMITTVSNKVIEPYKSRMPVVIEQDSIKQWLDTKNSFSQVKELLKPCEEKNIQIAN